MGLYDITIFNAIGGNESFVNNEQKMRAQAEYVLVGKRVRSFGYI